MFGEADKQIYIINYQKQTSYCGFMQSYHIQLSPPSHNQSPSYFMSKSQFYKNHKIPNMGVSQEIILNDRKTALNQMRYKIGGVEKLLKHRQRQFLSPSYLRGSVGNDNPQPKPYTKNDGSMRFNQNELRSSWNDHLFNMFDEKEDNTNIENKACTINKMAQGKISRGGQKSHCQEKSKRMNEQLRMKINQYQNKIDIPTIQGLKSKEKMKSPSRLLEKSCEGLKQGTNRTYIERKEGKQEKADKVRMHINKSMQVLELIKNNQAIKNKQIKKSNCLEKSQAPKVLFGFEFGKMLGKGKFGQVYLVKHIQTGFIAAIKKIDKSKIKQYNMVSQFSKEIKLHSSLDHPNIIKFFGLFEEKDDVYLALQYMNGGTLFQHLNNIGVLGIKEAVDFLRDVILGVSYLHDHSIAHRDIKPQNIVISTEGVAKICDLGWSSVVESARNTYCGTLDYACPEILERKEYDLSVDIWSIGILTYEMLMGKAPFEHKDRNLVRERIINVDHKHFDYSNNVPSQARQFIEALVQKEPTKRPKIHELLNFKLFTNFGSRGRKIN